MVDSRLVELRPITPLDEFDTALRQAELSSSDQELLEYIRYVGIFNQVSLTKELRLNQKPPVLSVLCKVCRKIGENIPEHFAAVREWSKKVSEYGVCWDGDLVCSIVWNIDGIRLTPEAGTSQYHTFAVHKELFNGLD